MDMRSFSILSFSLIGILRLSSAWVPCTWAADEAPTTPQTVFFQANALYSQGQYQQAAHAYERLRQAGLESGQLFFNLGNAYFKAGEKGKAILNYERARRLAPGDADVAANLAYVRSLTGAEACDPSGLQQLIFPLTHRFPTSTLVWLTSGAYTFFMLCLMLYRLWPRHPRWLVYTAVLLVSLFVVVGTSLARQVYVNDWQQLAVLVASGETSVRFEPAEDGTEHYVLPEGAPVHVLDTRADWYQIARCDGRRGWVAAHSVEQMWSTN